MKPFPRISWPFLVSVGLVLVSAACGSQAGSTMGPTGLNTTASISGTVQSGVSAAGVSTARHNAAGVRVTVIGTGASSTTDSSGRFVLTDIQAGKPVSLRFEAPGIDAVLGLGGLVAGQTLTITVSLSHDHATLDDPDDSPSPSPGPSPSPEPSPSPKPPHGHDGEVELKGVVESITPPSLMVAGRVVQTDANTEIKRNGDRIGLADLKLQDKVEVKGTTQADGSVLARKITVDSEGDDDDNGGSGDGDGDGDDQ
jgi:Domain of unknown function (DUF5666)